jgi:1-acyl-sn-glycerol-3-phosphate acyltransferase
VKRALRRIARLGHRYFARAVLYTFSHLEVRGREHVPMDGAAIFVSNHVHLLDPPLVMAVAPRKLHTMAKRELFETPLVGWFFWAMEAFPVRRYSADVGALRTARNLLRNGGAVLVFPEGTRSHKPGLQPALPGVAVVALLSGAPMVPVAVSGTADIHVPGVFLRWLKRRRPRLVVEFGEPFRLPEEMRDASHAEAASDFIMRRIAALLPEPYRGVYGPGTEGEVIFARQERPTSAPRRRSRV